MKVVAAGGHQPSLASQREEDSRDVSAESRDARKPRRLSCWLVGLSSAPPWRHRQEIRAGGAALSCPRTLRTHRPWAGPGRTRAGEGEAKPAGVGCPRGQAAPAGGSLLWLSSRAWWKPLHPCDTGPPSPEPAPPQHTRLHPGPRGPDPSFCHKGKLRGWRETRHHGQVVLLFRVITRTLYDLMSRPGPGWRGWGAAGCVPTAPTVGGAH